MAPEVQAFHAGKNKVTPTERGVAVDRQRQANDTVAEAPERGVVHAAGVVKATACRDFASGAAMNEGALHSIASACRSC